MVSGTLNNSNFFSFKSYWIFEILVKFLNFQTSKRIRNLKLCLKIQTFQLPKRIRYLKLWLKFQTFKIRVPFDHSIFFYFGNQGNQGIYL